MRCRFLASDAGCVCYAAHCASSCQSTLSRGDSRCSSLRVQIVGWSVLADLQTSLAAKCREQSVVLGVFAWGTQLVSRLSLNVTDIGLPSQKVGSFSMCSVQKTAPFGCIQNHMSERLSFFSVFCGFAWTCFKLGNLQRLDGDPDLSLS